MKEWLKENYIKCLIILVCLVLLLITIFLLVSKPMYDVSFDSVGGSYVSSIKVRKGDKITPPANPTLEGYDFIGWTYNGELYDFDKPVTKKMVLLASWSVKEGITLTKSTLTLKLGESDIIKILVNGEEVNNEDLIFISSDENIARVDNTGKVITLKNGRVNITVKTKDDKYSTVLEVIIDEEVDVESISITGEDKVMVGSRIKLSVIITPSNATNKNITWKSNNSLIASVDDSGNVLGVSAGTVTIVATTSSGKVASKDIIVTSKPQENDAPNNQGSQENTPEPPKNVGVTGVSLTGGATIKPNESVNLNVSITPLNATNKKYTCTSNNDLVATVDSNTCVVKGIDDGEAIITVTTDDGGYTATVTIKVVSTYVLEFTAVRNNVDKIIKYDVVLYKNGVKWDGYSVIEYNGRNEKFREPAIPAMIDDSITEAKVKVDGKVIATAQVLYK